jgi:very-short-patch-repair endonuclease
MALGFTRDEIQDRVAAGRLHRVHWGVYAVGHRGLTIKGRWLAAVLACGPEAALSHAHAVALWDLRPAPGGPIHVSGPGRRKGVRSGIRVHSVCTLHRRDRAEIDGIPVTSIHRTLLDYAAVARHQQLRLALEAAERRDLLDMNKFDELFARSRGRHGVRAIRAAIGELRGPAPWTQSELENRFLALIRDARIPEPQANVVVAGYVVDFFWPESRLVVEVDGYRYHKSRTSWERDRLKDAKLQLARCDVVRVTQERIEGGPHQLVRDVLELLSAERGSGRSGP